jgi:hypothetical protein
VLSVLQRLLRLQHQGDYVRLVLSKSLRRHSVGRSKGDEDGRIRGLESSDGGTQVGTLIEATRAIGV